MHLPSIHNVYPWSKKLYICSKKYFLLESQLKGRITFLRSCFALPGFLRQLSIHFSTCWLIMEFRNISRDLTFHPTPLPTPLPTKKERTKERNEFFLWKLFPIFFFHLLFPFHISITHSLSSSILSNVIFARSADSFLQFSCSEILYNKSPLPSFIFYFYQGAIIYSIFTILLLTSAGLLADDARTWSRYYGLIHSTNKEYINNLYAAVVRTHLYSYYQF